MRFETKWVTLFVLLGLVAMFWGVPRVQAGDDAVEVAKAKAKALFSLKAPAIQATATDLQPMRDVAAAHAEAKATVKPLYLWVGQFRPEIAERLPPGIHAITGDYRGMTLPHLVIKLHDEKYLIQQKDLDPMHLDLIKQMVRPPQTSMSRPPVVETSRWVPPIRDADGHLADWEKESPEPPARMVKIDQPKLQLSGNSGQLKKSCLCSPLCVCGCNEGRPCQCQSIQGAAAAPTHLGLPFAPPSFAGPVGIGEYPQPVPALIPQSFE